MLTKDRSRYKNTVSPSDDVTQSAIKGCHAAHGQEADIESATSPAEAVDTYYDVPSHDASSVASNSEEIGPARVATRRV